VILEKHLAQHRAQLRGDFDKAAVALPGLGVKQFLFLLLGRPFFRLPPSSSSPSSSSLPQSARRFSSAAETLAQLVNRSSPNSS
jgi:hypothetical protein